MLAWFGAAMHSGDGREARLDSLLAAQPGDPAPSKDALRRQSRRCRRQALAACTPGLRAVARERLPALLPPGAWLGLYLPVGSEPDLDPWAPGGLGARLALPAVLPPRHGETQGRLIYLPWEPDTPLRPDACGIPAPLPGEGRDPVLLPPAALGLLLVPALAVDRSGIRLGSGGGWYDRLRSDPAWRAVPALAVLPSACVVERLPRDPWDVPFHGWLDEHGIHAVEGQAAAGRWAC